MTSEGRQSPPPERQTGAQLQSPPGSGKTSGIPKVKPDNKESQLDMLESNPKGPLDEAVKQKFAKGVELDPDTHEQISK